MIAVPPHSSKLFAGSAVVFLICAASILLLEKYFWLPALLVFPFLLIAISQPKLLFYVLVAAIPWSAEIAISATLSTDFPDEPLMLVAAFVALTIIIYKGKSLWHQWRHSTLLVLLILQFSWMVVAVANSENIPVSIKFLLAKAWYLGAFLFLPPIFLREKKDWQTTALVLLISTLLCTLVIFVRHCFDQLTFDSINENVQPFFRNHVTYSALLICVLPLLYFFWRRSASRSVTALLVIVFVLAIAALYFSYARGAWLAALVGVVSFWLLKKRLLLFSYLLIFSIVIAVAFWLGNNNRYVGFAHDYNTTVFHTNFKEHWSATYQMKDVSTAERFYRWIAGVRMAKERLATGWGPTTFYPNYKSYAVPSFKTWVSANPERSTVHNYFLLTLIEQGVPGLSTLLLLLGLFFYKAQQLYRRTFDAFYRMAIAVSVIIMAELCTVNFLSDLVETDKTGSVFYLCFALLIWLEIKMKRGTLTEAPV